MQDGNMQDEKTGAGWRVDRDGKEVTVKEKDLTESEVRSLRCSEMLQEFMIAPLVEELARMNVEIEKRGERWLRLKMTDGAERFVNDLIIRWSRGGDKAGAVPFTKGEAKRLEELFVRTLPFATLSPEQEAGLRTRLRRTAAADFEAGKFQNIDDALKHYGLSAEVEGE